MLGWMDLSKFDFKVLMLFEEVQLQWLFRWHDLDVIAVLLKKYPEVSNHIKYKAPSLRPEIEELENKECSIKYTPELERDLINKLEDWIVYVTEPHKYDEQSFNSWDSNELLSLVDFRGKTVIDIGSGTGSQTFRIAPYAETIFSVEPIGNLRLFIKNKRDALGYNNIFVVDGLMSELPFPDNFSHVVVAGHVFGDYMDEEFFEMHRVVKTGGMIILIPGNSDEDNETHDFLMQKGFNYSSFLEPGDGMKRKYWFIKK
jgi:SAM-dependent methyltransferase